MSTQPPNPPTEPESQNQPIDTLSLSPPTTTPPSSSLIPPKAPNISLRTFIYFLPHPLPPGTPVPYTPGLPHVNPLNLPPRAFEPTSSLVLTSPGGVFVDLRYLRDGAVFTSTAARPSASASASSITGSKDTNRDEGESTIPSPPTPTANTTPPPPLPTPLDWGFAGSSSSRPAPVPHPVYGPYTHNAWTHWVDSRVRVGDEVAVDEGAMYFIRGGGGGRHDSEGEGGGVGEGEGEEEGDGDGGGTYVEHGWAFHPQLGRVAGHEEGWVDAETLGVPVSVSASVQKQLQKQDKNKTKTKTQKKCFVLRTHNPSTHVRGVIVRVGQYVQGIIMVGTSVATERWEYVFRDDQDDRNHQDDDSKDNKNGNAKDDKPQTQETPPPPPPPQSHDEKPIPQHSIQHSNHCLDTHPAANKKRTGWTRRARTGSWFLPCAVTWRDDGDGAMEPTLCVGAKVRYGEFEWVVEEAWCW